MEGKYSRYHCCASCVHYAVTKRREAEIVPYCARLGYETKPDYQFDCWEPKERVRRAIRKT